MIDYSKLSDEDLIALKNGDYSKISNSGLLILKGNNKEPVRPKNGFISDFTQGAVHGLTSIPTALGASLGNNLRPLFGKEKFTNEQIKQKLNNAPVYRYTTKEPTNFAGKSGEFIGGMLPYLALPEVELLQGAAMGAKMGNMALTGAYQGAIAGAGESIKNNGLNKNIVPSALTGSVTGGIVGGAIPLANGAWEKTKNGFKWAAKEYANLQPKTIEQAVKPNSKALDMSADDAQKLLTDTTRKVRADYDALFEDAGKKVGEAIDNLPKEKNIPINELKYTLDDIYDSYSKSGNKKLNRAYNEAGEIYDDINTNWLEEAKVPQAQVDRGNFTEAYDKMLKGEINPRKQIKILSETPEIWQQNGLENKNIITDQNILKKMGNLPNKYNKNHNIDDEIIKNLPDLLQDPNYILKSDTVPGRYLGILDAVDNNGKPIAVAMSPKINGLDLDVNFIPSAYGKDNFINFINKQNEKGNILFNKQGTLSQQVPAPIAGGGTYVPKDIISQLPQNSNINNQTLRELIEHLDDYGIKWDDPNKGIKNSILKQVSRAYRDKLSSLSPELKAANKQYGYLADFKDNDAINQILKGDLLKDGQLGAAPTALKNYNSTITKGSHNQNVQDLEKILTDNGYSPFLNNIDDVNAVQDLLKVEGTGRNLNGATGKAKFLIKPILRTARWANRHNLPQKIENIKNVVRPLSNGTKRLLPPLSAIGTSNLLYGEVNNYENN